MSKGWAKGSTTAWRRVRAFVLERDGWVCGLCGDPIDPRLATPHPRSAEVHHVAGVGSGDDPAGLAAAHRECNQAAGDPRAHDPEPRPTTRW